MGMVKIADFNTQDQAYMAQGMLQANGISAQVETNGLSTIFPGAGAGAALFVASDKADEAISLLKQHGDL